VVAERLFREIGYQKTPSPTSPKVLRMSPANVYRFFDSKKAIHEGVAAPDGRRRGRGSGHRHQHESAASRLRELMTTTIA